MNAAVKHVYKYIPIGAHRRMSKITIKSIQGALKALEKDIRGVEGFIGVDEMMDRAALSREGYLRESTCGYY